MAGRGKVEKEGGEEKTAEGNVKEGGEGVREEEEVKSQKEG